MLEIEPEVNEPSADDGKQIEGVRAAEERKGGPEFPSPAGHSAFYRCKRPDDRNPGYDDADEPADDAGQAREYDSDALDHRQELDGADNHIDDDGGASKD